jgi:ribonuclease Z
VEVVEVRPGEALERDGYRILAFPVDHGTSAVGYAIDEAERPGEFDVEAANVLGVPSGPERGVLQRGGEVTLADGRVIEASAVVGPARPGRRILIPGDTAPTETVRVLAAGADVLVHEASFGADEEERAAETLHSTARQAAEIARDAGVRLLALTHVSPRYFGPELLREAREVFPSTVLPRDFDIIEVPLAERGVPVLVKGGARPDDRQERSVSEPVYPATS